jgi:hypothetical protein
VTVTLLVALACSDTPRTLAGNGVPTWRVSTDPEVVIGTEGDPRYEFHRITGIATLSDRSIVVADAGSQIRVYDENGRFIRSLGGPGEGPGEFTGTIGIAVRGDSILVRESFPAPARIHAFDAESGFLYTTLLRPEGESSGVAARAIVSTSILVVVPGRGFRVLTPPPEGTVVRDSVRLGLLRLEEGQVVTWLGYVPESSFYSYSPSPGGRSRLGAGTYTLGPSLQLATSGGLTWVGDPATGTISLFDTTGAVAAQVEHPLPARALDEKALEQVRVEKLEQIGDDAPEWQRASIEALYARELRPATAPRFGKFTAGPDGEMWIECYSEIRTAEHCAVTLDRTRNYIGRTTIPEGFVLHAVDRDRVIGLQTAANGIQHIVIHELRR